MSLAAPLFLAALLDAASGSSKNVTATLLVETDAVQPGRPLVAAIRLRMAPEWHTYWKNPGDAGLATRVTWNLPAGFAAGPLQWPRPARMPADPLMSYGYVGEVLLLTEIRTPAQIGAHDVTLGAHVSWLECREACLPGKATLELTLPVSASARPSPQLASAFRETRERFPRSVTSLKAEAIARPSEFLVSVAGAPPTKKAYFFADTPGVVEHGAPQKLSLEGGTLRLAVPRNPNAAAPEALTGVLELDAQAYDVRALVRAVAASK